MKNIITINKVIPVNLVQTLLREVKKGGYHSEYEYDRHRLIISDTEGQNELSLRLPINFLLNEQREHKANEENHYIILLIQAGSCAMGLFNNDIVEDHKVYKSYMVRKKQGKSQIKYLNAKGKSRAGSRVRLSNTIDFFENINERLQQYFDEHSVNRIALSCSKTILPFLYNSKVNCPFDKKDARLYKIPKHIPSPGYDVLMGTHRFLLKADVTYKEPHTNFASELLKDHLQ